ncbi:MAG: L-rhamnose isomerase [Clostridiaceae bacterium]|nr:L-rhamnose isomerase [Clostridiaceae bacterium]
MNNSTIIEGYKYAKEILHKQNVDVDFALDKLDKIPLSMQCWQGDDVRGFDSIENLSGGITSTGNYIGIPRNIDELRSDIKKAVSLIPGKLKLNLHASYVDKSDQSKDRDSYSIQDFQTWIDFVKKLNMGMDFNPTFFSHPKMDGNFSLSSKNEKIRSFWIEHGKRCREIGLEFAKQTGEPCIVNFWMPDGYKDICVDTVFRRELMLDSLDRIFATDIDSTLVPCSVESKLFGIGIEGHTVVNHEFAYGYCLKNNLLYCLDAGHFHPTELISTKISSLLFFMDRVSLHVSRNVHWDSDHIVILNDELQAIMDEIVWHDWLDRVHIATDFFDASVNRIAAWVIGIRNCRKALLSSLLAPYQQMREYELNEDFTSRIALQEARKMLPLGAVWNYYCYKNDMPLDHDIMPEINLYEKETLLKRQ